MPTTARLTAYVSAPADPMIRTWARIFPGIFQPIDSMPADLRSHIRYPDDLYRVQTTLYTSYHMEAPEDFYHREDQWQIPTVAEAQASVPFMRHIVMRLPDEPRRSSSTWCRSHLGARTTWRRGWWRGTTVTSTESSGSTGCPPEPRLRSQQIENRINQDTEISRQVSLWDQEAPR